MTSDSRFSVYGRMVARPGRRDDLIDGLLAAVRAVGEDAGLLGYSINAAVDDPDAVWLTELWVDRATHDAVTRSEPVVTASGGIGPLLAGPIESSYGHVLHVRSAAVEP